MKKITFETTQNWTGIGKKGEGNLSIANQALPFASPAEMGGSGVGVSPEDLLLAAVATCYTGTLFGIITKNHLPVTSVSVRAEGTVTGFPKETAFEQITVHPTIIGGDGQQETTYGELAKEARDACFIGQSIKGNIDYHVGTIKVVHTFVEQTVIDELVETFYHDLIQKPAFQILFAEREVDVEKLIERQKDFISQLVNNEDAEQDNVPHIQNRHSFTTNPERSNMWIETMKETVNKLAVDATTKQHILAKIQHLYDNM